MARHYPIEGWGLKMGCFAEACFRLKNCNIDPLFRPYQGRTKATNPVLFTNKLSTDSVQSGSRRLPSALEPGGRQVASGRPKSSNWAVLGDEGRHLGQSPAAKPEYTGLDTPFATVHWGSACSCGG